MVFCSFYTLPPSGEKRGGGSEVVATIDCNLEGKDLCFEYQQCIFGAREATASAGLAAAAAWAGLAAAAAWAGLAAAAAWAAPDASSLYLIWKFFSKTLEIFENELNKVSSLFAKMQQNKIE